MRPVSVLSMFVLLCAASSLLAAQKTGKQPKARNVSPSAFYKVTDDFFAQAVFRFNPTQGTAAGLHQYDTQLEDFSPAGVAAQVAALKEYAARFEGMGTKKWPLAALQDRELVLASIQSSLLELEQIKQWERNPDRYPSNISSSAFLIMARTYASEDERLRALIAREQLMPGFLKAGESNLKNVPQVYAEVAMMQLPGIVRFFEKDVPMAFKHVTDKQLLAAFGESNAGVVTALRDYQKYLEKNILPNAKGDFRIGADNYRKKLLYDEMVDLPLDRLLEIGMADLRKNQQWYKDTAAKLDAGRTPQQVLTALGKEHPAPDHLLQAFRDVLGGLQDFIVNNKIVTIPSKVQPIVEETPPFARALTFASMDTPGPFEKVAKEAYFNVTLPDPAWTAKDVEEHMAGFNYGTIISTAVHEAYPGHYTQFLWVPSAPSNVRKLLGTGSNAEGWAHYCEQMMLDEGYGIPKGGTKDSPEYLKLRLGQLQDALLRNARFIVGIQMHTGKMTFEEGVEFFIQEGFQSKSNAMRETRRGTSDPTYLVYTMGKLQILRLREDYSKLKGKDFSLQEFHDNFLKQGFPPVKQIRRQMLGDESPSL